MRLLRLVAALIALVGTPAAALTETNPAESAETAPAADETQATPSGKPVQILDKKLDEIKENLDVARGQLDKERERLDKEKECLARIQDLIGLTAQACGRTIEARKHWEDARKLAVEAAKKTHGLLAAPADASEAKTLQTKAEDVYSKSQVHLDTERASLEAYVTAFEDELDSIQNSTEFTDPFKKIATGAVEDAMKALESAIDAVSEKTVQTREATEQPEPQETPAPPEPNEVCPAPAPPQVLGPVAEPPALFAPAATESTSQGEQYLQRQVDPFFLQPLVSVIPTAEQLSDFATKLQPPGESDDSTRKADDDCFVVDYRFVQPARFPLPVFGFNGECLEEPGASCTRECVWRSGRMDAIRCDLPSARLPCR